MNIEDINDAVVKAALKAMSAGDKDAWFALFAPDAILTDDGHDRNFTDWSTQELFADGGHVTAIDKIEDDGRMLYAQFHSNRWGDFATYMKFAVQNGKITRLDVGQL